MLGLYGARSSIPEDLVLAEIGLIRHVTGDGGVIAEDAVLYNRLAAPDRFKEGQEMGLVVVPIVAE